MRQRDAGVAQVGRHLASRAEFGELGEYQPDGGLDRLVGREHDATGGVVVIAHRQVDGELAAAGLLPQPTRKPRADQVQLGLTHRPFEAEQQPVVELAGMVDAVGVGDEGIDHAAQVEQPIPVAIVAGQPRGLQPEHDADPSQADLGDQPLKAGPRGAGTAHAKVVVDHHDLLADPAKLGRPLRQRVLTPPALGVGGHLAGGRLAHVDGRPAVQMRGGDLGVDHGRPPVRVAARRRASSRAR